MITNFIKGQRKQWLGNIMQKGENEQLRAVLEWVPQGKKPRGRPKKDGWMEQMIC